MVPSSFFHIFSDITNTHLQAVLKPQTIVKGFQILFIRGIEIRQLVAGTEKGENRKIRQFPLVVPLALVEGHKKGRQGGIVTFKQLIQQDEIAFCNLSLCLDAGPPALQFGDGAAEHLQLFLGIQYPFQNAFFL